MTEREQPHDDAAERAVLSACMVDARAVDVVEDVLDGQEWYQSAHVALWRAIVALRGDGAPIDSVSIVDRLRASGELEAVGGIVTVTQIMMEVASAANVRYHAQLIRDAWLRRRIIEQAHSLSMRAYAGDEPSTALLEEAEAQLTALADTKQHGDLQALEGILAETLKHIEAVAANKGEPIGVRTGFGDLDRMTGGFQGGDLIIIAGRPSMGKTALALTFAHRAAQDGKTVALFSLEMAKRQLAVRHLSMHSRVPSLQIRKGELGKADWGYLWQAAKELATLPLYIDDRPALSVPEVAAACRRQQRETGLDLVLIDYLQLLRPTHRSSSSEQEVSQLSAACKTLARQLNVPVVTMSQLSRKCEERRPPRPILSDLRSSGSIEQDADLVAFVYRAEAYGLRYMEVPRERGNPMQMDAAGMAEIIVAKQRNGPTGSVLARWDAQLTSFSPYALETYHTPPPEVPWEGGNVRHHDNN